jgi:transposase InsO family protein
VLASPADCAITLTLAGPARYHALFVIDLAIRRVEAAGIVHQPHEAWMLQMVRNLTDAADGFLLGKRYLIMDRDSLFTGAFRTMLAAASVKSVRLPARSPNLNAYAERFVRSVRDECLSKVMPLSEMLSQGREGQNVVVAPYGRGCSPRAVGAPSIGHPFLSREGSAVVSLPLLRAWRRADPTPTLNRAARIRSLPAVFVRSALSFKCKVTSWPPFAGGRHNRYLEWS